MHILLVLAHPLAESFAAAVARTARDALEAGGHTVDVLDLYREEFDPRLTASERAGYFDIPYDLSGVAKMVARLKAAEGLDLRISAMVVRLSGDPQGFLRSRPRARRGLLPRRFRRTHPAPADQHQIALGSDHDGVALVDGPALHGQSGRRLLRRGVAPLCAKRLNFRVLSLHDMDRAGDADRRSYLERVRKALRAI